jgi:hypothetical protein
MPAILAETSRKSTPLAIRQRYPYTPQTKGKVERSVGVVKHSFWPGVRFTDIDDLNAQALSWCDRINQRVHRTTRQAPLERWVEEPLAPLPRDFAWERFGAEERRVSWDGFISYDGVLYGLPSDPPVAGTTVQVRERARELRVFHHGQLIATLHQRPRSQEIVLHPEQFRHVVPASAQRQALKPLGHRVEAPAVAIRPLAEYDQLFGVEVGQ